MYEQFFGLSCKPFSLLPDPDFLYLSKKHDLAMSLLEYAVSSDLVLSVVTGEVGSGKTTLVRQLLKQLGPSVSVGLISNTHHDYKNLMQFVAMSYGIEFKDKEEVELFRDFAEFLEDEYVAGRRTLLIVDEAQNLTPHEVKTVITRAGENAKFIFTGDVNQIDTPYLDEQSNGLSYLIDKIKGNKLFAHVLLEKGERSELANLANELLWALSCLKARKL